MLRNLKPLSRADLEVAFGHAAKLYKVKTLLKPATTSFDLSPDSPQVAGKGRILQLVEASAVNYAPTTVDFRPRFNGSFHSSAAVTFEIDVIAGRVYLFDCHLAHGNYSLFFIGGNAPTGLTITGPDTDAHFVAPTFAAQSGKMVLFLNNADENVSWIWGGCTVTPSN